MTTAIEQAKREMYMTLSSLTQLTNKAELGALNIGQSATSEMHLFQSKLESYLEQLRQQYEEMASTAHQRFESIQSLEKVNQDLIEQLAKMTESRDMFRNLHQAATHASTERVGEASTSGQTSGDRASCEQTDAKAMAIEWDGEGLPPVGVVCEVDGSAGPTGFGPCRILYSTQDVTVWKYLASDLDQPTSDVEHWAAYGEREFRLIRTPEQIAAQERNAGIKSILDDYVHTEGSCTFHLTSKQAARIYDVGYRKPSCMHSFFAIGDDQFKCTFCGVGK